MTRRGAGARGRRGPARRQTPASERRGASPCPPLPARGHFLYDRWADAGFAPALRTIVRNPHPALRARPAVEGGRRDPPFLLQSPAPTLSGPARLGMLLPRPPLFRLQRLLLPPGQAEGIAALKLVPLPTGGRLLRRSEASWAQPRWSLGLQSRLCEGPLPPRPPDAEATFLFVPLSAAAPRRPSVTRTLALAPGGAAPPAAAKLPARPRPAAPCAQSARCGRRRPSGLRGTRRGGAGLAAGDGAVARALLRPRPRPAR